MAKFDIDVRPTAQQDLKNIHDWISERASPAIALAYVRKIQSSYMSLSDFPERGTRSDHLVRGLRTYGIDRRVTIAFRISGRTVTILRVLYGGRDLKGAVTKSGS